MRPDFVHLYTVRPRRGGDALVRPGRAPRDPDDLPLSEGIAGARRRGYERKRRDFLWSALKRWLRAQVGRPWNTVFSELCAVADARSGAARPLREHIHWYVERDVYVDERGVPRDAARGWEVDGFWVDGDGVLRLNERPRPRWKPKQDAQVIEIDRLRALRRIDGIWYEVRYAELKAPERIERKRADGTNVVHWKVSAGYDVVERRTVWREPGRRWVAPVTRYACAKRALSKKELRQHRLTNR